MTADKVPGCSQKIVRTARLISGKWTLLILHCLTQDRQRFSILQKLLGISPRTLSSRLSQLEEAGVLLRERYSEIPPRVEYSLTEKGKGLIPIVEAMRDYAEKWM